MVITRERKDRIVAVGVCMV
jgi:hypothetical protein